MSYINILLKIAFGLITCDRSQSLYPSSLKPFPRRARKDNLSVIDRLMPCRPGRQFRKPECLWRKIAHGRVPWGRGFSIVSVAVTPAF